MQVFCTDGTVFRCRSYEVTQHGVQLYGAPLDEEGEERYSDDPEMMGVRAPRSAVVHPPRRRPVRRTDAGRIPAGAGRAAGIDDAAGR